MKISDDLFRARNDGVLRGCTNFPFFLFCWYWYASSLSSCGASKRSFDYSRCFDWCQYNVPPLYWSIQWPGLSGHCKIAPPHLRYSMSAIGSIKLSSIHYKLRVLNSTLLLNENTVNWPYALDSPWALRIISFHTIGWWTIGVFLNVYDWCFQVERSKSKGTIISWA